MQISFHILMLGSVLWNRAITSDNKEEVMRLWAEPLSKALTWWSVIGRSQETRAEDCDLISRWANQDS